MKSLKRIGTLAVTALAAWSCEDITNPVEEFGQLEGPYVRFENESAVGGPGSTVLIPIVMTTRVEEDVTVDFAFGGDAVFGQDFVVVDGEGNVRTDVTAAGGTAEIPYRFEETSFARDTLFVRVPADATNGRSLDIEITGARTASGRTVEPGLIESHRRFSPAIRVVATGTYGGQRTGDFGTANVMVTISQPAQPIVIDGTAFSFVISDFTGDAGLGPVIPWAFNVTGDGTVRAAGQSHAIGVTANVSGQYDFDTQRLTLNVTFTCCGVEGGQFQLTVARQ